MTSEEILDDFPELTDISACFFIKSLMRLLFDNNLSHNGLSQLILLASASGGNYAEIYNYLSRLWLSPQRNSKSSRKFFSKDAILRH